MCMPWHHPGLKLFSWDFLAFMHFFIKIKSTWLGNINIYSTVFQALILYCTALPQVTTGKKWPRHRHSPESNSYNTSMWMWILQNASMLCHQTAWQIKLWCATLSSDENMSPCFPPRQNLHFISSNMDLTSSSDVGVPAVLPNCAGSLSWFLIISAKSAFMSLSALPSIREVPTDDEQPTRCLLSSPPCSGCLVTPAVQS